MRYYFGIDVGGTFINLTTKLVKYRFYLYFFARFFAKKKNGNSLKKQSCRLRFTKKLSKIINIHSVNLNDLKVWRIQNIFGSYYLSAV